MYKIKLWSISIFLCIAVITHCSNENNNPEKKCPQNTCKNCLLVGTTDYDMGGLSLIDLDDTNQVCTNFIQPHQDHVLTYGDSDPLVISRLGKDSILRLDKTTLEAIYEESVGPNTNPSDIVKGKANELVVSLHDRAFLGIHDSTNGKYIRKVDFPPDLVDADGIPEASDLYTQGDNILISLGFLDNTMFFNSRGIGKIAQFNKITDKLTLFVELDSSPLSPIIPHKQSLFISVNDMYGMTSHEGDGIVEIPIQANETAGIPTMLISEETAGLISINSFIIVNDTLGFLLGALPSFQYQIKAFNPTTKAVGALVIEGSLSSSSSGMLVYDNKLYVADRSITDPGIRIYNVHTLEEITTSPINVGLPPDSLLLIQR